MREERSRQRAGAHEATSSQASFAEYRRTRDRRLRDQLVQENQQLAYRLANRFIGRGADREELRQVALIALAQAVERFDPSYGVAFSSFAVPTISGALKRHFRDRSWALRPPRVIQERYLAVAQAVEDLAAELRRTPTTDDVTAAGEWSRHEVEEALAARAHRSHDQWTPSEQDDPAFAVVDDDFDDVERRMVVDQLIDVLAERDRRILELRFYDELTQSDIAARMGVSQMHVSRQLVRIIGVLRRAAVARDLLPVA